MKYTSILSAAAMALALTACDNIDENDRLIPIDFAKSDKVVLVEEFTGSRCPNCPDGAATIASIHEHPVYGARVIPVSLYPTQLSSLTRPFSSEQDLRTAEARDIFAVYNTRNALPAAMFNRRTFNDAVLQVTYTQWGGFVSSIFDEGGYPPVNIDLSCNYNKDTRELTINYHTQFVDEIQEEILFQVYVVENGVVTQQSSTAGIIEKYTNNHVLRKAVNGTWGTSYSDGHLPGSSFEDSVTTTLKDNWNADNIQVIGFICYASGNREVLHAALLESITDNN
ncbi:MAG: Omp28 family outer membrane lipoprotein [Muribaculaceae bacterium]|nr:Omp28 family outer membrane lipoprotein [Muribaculaceae bacterium]